MIASSALTSATVIILNAFVKPCLGAIFFHIKTGILSVLFHTSYSHRLFCLTHTISAFPCFLKNVIVFVPAFKYMESSVLSSVPRHFQSQSLLSYHPYRLQGTSLFRKRGRTVSHFPIDQKLLLPVNCFGHISPDLLHRMRFHITKLFFNIPACL